VELCAVRGRCTIRFAVTTWSARLPRAPILLPTANEARVAEVFLVPKAVLEEIFTVTVAPDFVCTVQVSPSIFVMVPLTPWKR